MKLIFRLLAFLALLSAAPAGESVNSPLPILTLPIRVHLMQSATDPALQTTLTETDLKRIFTKVNKVWAAAGIQFEVESISLTQAIALPKQQQFPSEFDQVSATIPNDRLSPTAINVCYLKTVTPNGFYTGKLIVVKDTAALREVPGGLDEPLPRVTSHEIGHVLGLPHRQDLTNLMQSGTTGFSLNEQEIAITRAHAQQRLSKATPAAVVPAVPSEK